MSGVYQSTECASQIVPLNCEKEPIHIINRIQPCGCLIVVDSRLNIIQCSTNAVDYIKEGADSQPSKKKPKLAAPPRGDQPPEPIPLSSPVVSEEDKPYLDKLIGSHLSLIFPEESVEKVRSVIQHVGSAGCFNSEATRNFLIRSKGMIFQGEASCSVIQSGEHFLLEIEDLLGAGIPQEGVVSSEDRGTMVFMEGIAKELRRCWSMEEMASLVCSKIMAETPYDRGMVYRFDPVDHSGEIIYESFRQDARYECRKDSFLGLRFPASDIPRQARDLFMRNTLRFVYNVNGKDWALYPSKVQSTLGNQYTDLSFCRLRGSSFMHLKYLQNMKVTSTMVIAIIVNKKLWGLYSFHGYRQPLLPSARTRFLCEMASIMTSMVMESLTRMSEHERLMSIDNTMHNLHKSSFPAFLEKFHDTLKDGLDVNLIGYRIHEPFSTATFGPVGVELTNEVFDAVFNTYGSVCKDYGVVFIDEQNSHPTLVSSGLTTLAFYHMKGLDLLLSRRSVIESVQWGGDPNKKCNPDGTLTPRNSFAAFKKNYMKKGRPWNETDKQFVRRFFEQIEKYRSNEIFKEHKETIQSLEDERNQVINDAKENFDFFAHMAHELRTPFHGILSSLEAMREDPALANNELLKTADLCGKSMIKILDDILLVAKGSYSLDIEEQEVNIQTFLHQTLKDMMSYAYMEGVSIRVRKEDVFHKFVAGDFNRVRQVVNNLISNAIKFSDDDLHIELLQRKTISDVVSVWKTYTHMYPNHEPSLDGITAALTESSRGEKDEAPLNDENTAWIILSVIDRGIGISGVDLKRVGTAFMQLSSGRIKKYQGTGLGLNICNLLVTALKGKLVIFSAPGHGSCFTFALPVKMTAEPPPAKPKAPALEQTQERIKKLRDYYNDNGCDKLKLKILVVDDSSINRKLCKRKINKWLPGITVTECASGQTALDEYFYDHVSIVGIFMDFHMPGMDGDLCTHKIREYEETHQKMGHVYIAGYTADALEDSIQLLLKAGMDCVIPKPETPAKFENALQQMMETHTGMKARLHGDSNKQVT